MEDTDDVFVKFENRKTPKLNDVFWNDFQRQIREYVRENGGGGGDSEEIGSVKIWFSNTIPSNWLLLDGQAVSRTEYSELFAIIGTTFGEGDGSTTFNLPDMRGRAPVGLDINDIETEENNFAFNVLGKKVGEKKHTMTLAELVAHFHNDGVKTDQLIGGSDGQDSCTVLIDKSGGQTDSTGESKPFNVVQPSICVNFIVKAKKNKIVDEKITLEEVLEEVNKIFEEKKKNSASLIFQGRKIYTLTEWIDSLINQGVDLKTVGDAFSVLDSGIKVNKDMTVALSAEVATYECPQSSQFSLKIVGSISGLLALVNSNTMNTLMSHQITPIIREVKAGEIIKLYINTQVHGNYQVLGDSASTYLTIQEL